MDRETPESQESGGGPKKPLILVVDDDQVHLKLMELLAEQLGIIPYMASSCAEAIEALRMFSFDAILMDYRMPLVDGCECAKQIRELNDIRKNIPMIMVSAHVLDDGQELCRGSGMDDYLPKPFSINELKEKLEHWIKAKNA